MELIWCTGKH